MIPPGEMIPRWTRVVLVGGSLMVLVLLVATFACE